MRIREGRHVPIEREHRGRGPSVCCLFRVDPDAHATGEVDNIRWGVLMARKGAVPKDRVINTLDGADFAAWIARRRPRWWTVSEARTRPERKRGAA